MVANLTTIYFCLYYLQLIPWTHVKLERCAFPCGHTRLLCPYVSQATVIANICLVLTLCRAVL